MTYNGSVPGPTLRVRPGDTLRVTLENRLDQPTNLHTHGLHVSPSGSADNVFVTIDPGASRAYEYKIPADHPSGTFWYHPHHHHLVAPQLTAGLAGAIVVEDDVDARPGLAGAVPRVVVVSDPRIGSDASVVATSMMETMMGREGDAVLVNGALEPGMATAVGQTEHWRIVNACSSRYLRLRVPGLAVHQVATDGGRLAGPRAVTELLLTPGERAEVLVPATKAGRYDLVALPYDRGGMGMMRQMMNATVTNTAVGGGYRLATLAVSGPTRAARALPSALRTVDDLRSARVDRRRTLSFEESRGMGMGMGAMSFTIDGKEFDPDRVDQRVALGTVEEWTIENTTPLDHPFHLHVWPFQVVARSAGGAVAGWKDTVNVPAFGWVRLRIAFRDFAGKAVYHCHILDHEDAGMMGVIEVR